ncbi:MAG: hypothetical protein QOH95_1039 [Gaiellaceae bacterium]|jgi:hypothetical protein|nr:hypothetical protein [Gaiellaceae bacterium]
MTLVRISDESFLQLLVADMLDADDLIAEVLGDDIVEFDLLGSYGIDEMTVAMELRLRAWETAQRARGLDVSLKILD